MHCRRPFRRHVSCSGFQPSLEQLEDRVTPSGLNVPSASPTQAASYYAYDPATKSLTITIPAGQNRFSFAEGATVDSSGKVHLGYSFITNGVMQNYTDDQLVQVVVNAAGTDNTAQLFTDEMANTGGQGIETVDRVTIGNGTATVQPVDANDNATDFLTLHGFPTIYAGLGSSDEGLINGTPNVQNIFTSFGSYAYMTSGSAYYYMAGVANTPRYIYAYAASPDDIAVLYTGSGPSAYVGSGNAYALMVGTDNGQAFFNEAVGFKYAEGIATMPGLDVAYFYDSALDDCFIGYTSYSYLYADTGDYNGDILIYNNAASGFAQVYAYSFVGGTDYASNYDTSVNHIYGFLP
jgi:hypothetical protein